MTHPCYDYWHYEADALFAALVKHPRGAARLMYDDTYVALETALRRIESALGLAAALLPGHIRHVVDDPTVRGLADAFVTWLDNDENNAPPGPDPHRAGMPGWLNTGIPDTGAAIELTDLYGRIRNALGG